MGSREKPPAGTPVLQKPPAGTPVLQKPPAGTPVLLVVFFGIAVVLCLADRTPLYPVPRDTPYTPEALFNLYLDKAVHQDLPGPHAYRILVPFLVSGIASASLIPPLTIDFFLKVLVLTGVQVMFFLYLSSFFDIVWSMLGVALLDIYCGAALSYPVGPSVIETGDLLNVLAFSVALAAIYERRLLVLGLTLFIGMLNRETPWLILPVAALADWRPRGRVFAVALATLCLAVPYVLLHLFIHSPSPDWWLTRDIGGNIPFLDTGRTATAFVANARVALMLGPLLIPALFRFRNRVPYLKITAIVIPPFLLIHYIVGRVIEMRLWIPLMTILIPLALDGFRLYLSERLPARS